MSPARKKLNIVLTVVTVAIAVTLMAMITMLIVTNFTSRAGKNVDNDVSLQSSQSDISEPDSAPKTEPIFEPEDDIFEIAGTDTDDLADRDVSTSAGEEIDVDDDDDAETEILSDIADVESASEPDTDEPDEIAVHNEDIQAAIDRIAERYGAAGVQVAVISGGEIVGTYVYGDATKGVSTMTDDTKIRVASISKVVLAMTIMRLCELGRLDIDADIGVYWGAGVRNPNHSGIPITMRQMLSHTSSIIVYDYGFAADGALIRRRFLDGSCFGSRVPGAIGSWSYNNYAFAALGVTVEIATGETVNDLAARHLFEPLGIDAAFGSGSISDTGNLATLYTNNGGVGRSSNAQRATLGSTYPGESGEEFPGGLTISAYDLAKLVAALAGGGSYRGVRILSSESVALMEASQGSTGGFDQCLPLRRRTNIYGETELYYHTGSNYGVYNLISFNPVSADGVVVLTSGASGSTDANGIYAICGEISEYIYRNM